MRWLAALALWAGVAGAAERWEGNYPEGPLWVGETLYWAEMTADRVMRWQGGTPEVFFELPGCGPTAIARYRNRDYIVACHMAGKLAQLNAAGELIRTISSDNRQRRLRNPNDVASDGEGGVWFTDPGPFSAAARPQGAVLHIDHLGRVTRHVDGLAYGNGVHVDGTRLLVSEHLGGRVLAYPIGARLGPPEVVADLRRLLTSGYAEAGPDGLERGPDGRLWVALYGEAKFAVIGDSGIETVEAETPYLTNIAFAPDGRRATTGAFDNAGPPAPGLITVTP